MGLNSNVAFLPFLNQKERRRLSVFRLGALAGSLLTRLEYIRLSQVCHPFATSEKVIG
jgi:hypothetical protein